MKRLFKNFPANKVPFTDRFGYGGFSVVEVIVALAVMLVVLVGIISIFTSLNRTYTAQNVAAAVQQVTRTGIDIIARNIRTAGFNPQNANLVGIVEASTSKIRFHCDLNGSGSIEADADPREDIAFLLNRNNQLIRQNNGNSRTNRSIIDNVMDLKFRYYDANDRETNILDAIRAVEISLTVREKAGRKQFLSRTYSTRVICRNLGLQ